MNWPEVLGGEEHDMERQGLKMEVFLVCLKISKDVSVAGTEWMRERKVGKKTRDETGTKLA